ncbi:uncharacterized protein LOC131264550 [Anopheles coustani]|uniref:uncharacterized protein LOC131264550 n=1 Tax=Anopheles coustani TaxID=139045 RepID=UPI002659477A|nr:uncharacterized protein LOC131264550 [Anopheles coustani]
MATEQNLIETVEQTNAPMAISQASSGRSRDHSPGCQSDRSTRGHGAAEGTSLSLAQRAFEIEKRRFRIERREFELEMERRELQLAEQLLALDRGEPSRMDGQNWSASFRETEPNDGLFPLTGKKRTRWRQLIVPRGALTVGKTTRWRQLIAQLDEATRDSEEDASPEDGEARNVGGLWHGGAEYVRHDSYLRYERIRMQRDTSEGADRPLTYIPLDDEEAAPITPNHILLGSSNGEKPRVTLDDSPSAVRSSWEAAQRNADHFWKLWVRDYLPILNRRTKWFHPVRPISEGDIVIIADKTAPRNQCLKGEVIKVAPARDGQVRRATVQTTAGVYERPASKLAILDVSHRDIDK